VNRRYPAKAMRYLAHQLFHTELVERPAGTQRRLLRAVWRKIDDYYADSFKRASEDLVLSACEAMDREWVHDEVGVGLEMADLIQEDLLAQREFTLTLGKCGAMIELMCAENGTIRESCLEYIADKLET
jgi:hypothetical protein